MVPMLLSVWLTHLLVSPDEIFCFYLLLLVAFALALGLIAALCLCLAHDIMLSYHYFSLNPALSGYLFKDVPSGHHLLLLP